MATEAVGYQQHVGEYGTHWNFFLTLALTTQPVAALLARNPLQSHNDSSLLAAGLLVAAMHEGMLCAGGLALVMQNPRGPGWASLNKEGLLSLPGYLALALVAAWTGRRVAQWCAAVVCQECLQHSALKLGQARTVHGGGVFGSAFSAVLGGARAAAAVYAAASVTARMQPVLCAVGARAERLCAVAVHVAAALQRKPKSFPAGCAEPPAALRVSGCQRAHGGGQHVGQHPGSGRPRGTWGCWAVWHGSRHDCTDAALMSC